MLTNVAEKISVCLLTYNHVNIIESTILSILDQSVSGYEVIVSDDCSNDGTWEKILSLAATDKRLKPVRTPRNLGMPGNANYAVAQSSRPYIALLHHDDLYRRDLLEKWADVFERHPSATFVFNPYGVVDSSFLYAEPMPGDCFAGKWLLENRLFARWGCIVRGTAMIRREVWEKVGGMRDKFGLLADIDMWMRLSLYGEVGYVPEPVIVVRDQRPSYYPDIYKGSSGTFWQRQRFLYDIHSSNLREYLVPGSFLGKLKWLGFRWRLSLETAKWLCYARLRKKHDMLETSRLASVPEEFIYVRWLRSLLTTVCLTKK